MAECSYCEKKIDPKDLLYPRMHYECGNKALKDLEKLRMIRILEKHGPIVKWEIRNSFQDLLDQEMKTVRSHIVSDSTVDDDILQLFAVASVVLKCVPKDAPSQRSTVYCEWMFNTLMLSKYGSPLPENKRFYHRVKEFAKEVHSIPISKELFDLFKRSGKSASN